MIHPDEFLVDDLETSSNVIPWRAGTARASSTDGLAQTRLLGRTGAIRAACATGSYPAALPPSPRLDRFRAIFSNQYGREQLRVLLRVERHWGCR